MAVIEKSDLIDRIGPDAVRRILDDDNDGTEDDNAVTRLITDGTSYVLEALEDVWPLEEPYPPAVVRLALDACTAYAAQRHPEYVRRDWEKLFNWIDKQLDKLRDAKRVMGDGNEIAPEDAATIYTDARRGW